MPRTRTTSESIPEPNSTTSDLEAGSSEIIPGIARVSGFQPLQGTRSDTQRRYKKLAEKSARNQWEVDVRPYGRFRSIPIQGAKPIALSSREIAESVLFQIRAEIQAGKSEWAAVAPYLPRSNSTVDKIVDRWCEVMRERVEAKDLAPRTLKRIDSYKAAGGHFSWLYEYSVYEITAGHLEDWNRWLMTRKISQNT